LPFNLVSLNISNNMIDSLSTEEAQSLPKTLEILDFSKNKLTNFIESEALQSLSQLKYLNLSHNFLNQWKIISNGEKQNNMEVLDLSFNVIPELVEKNFANLPNLKILNLSHIRQLEHIDPRAYEGLSKKMKTVDLSFGHIYRLDFLEKLFEKQQNNNMKVSLIGNDFVCDCHLKKSLELLNSFSNQIDDNEKLACSSPPSFYGVKLRDLQTSQLRCKPSQALLRVLEVSPEQVRAQCIFADTDTLQWTLDNLSLDGVASQMEETELDPEKHIVMSTLTLDHESFFGKFEQPIKSNSEKSRKNRTENEKNLKYFKETQRLACIAQNEYGTARRSRILGTFDPVNITVI
ncbi:MAG: hypothetical protein MHPSP_003382, partial [Paramarteilia canceri]